MVKYETILRAAVGIIAPSMMPVYEGIRRGIGDIPEKLNKEIDKTAIRGEACLKARDVVSRYNTSESVKEFIRENPSSIGTDIYKNREENCAKFLKQYIAWLVVKTEHLTHVPDIPALPKIGLPDMPSLPSLPDMPSLPSLPVMPSLPSLPDIGGVKRSLQVSAIVLIGVVLVIVYMLTGKGERGI